MKPLYKTGMKVGLFGLICATFLAYTIIRAHTLSFTHDESRTYLKGVAPSSRGALLLSWKDAANHPLNTWGMYLSSKLFGVSELSLRLPNIIAHLLYLVSSAMFVRKLQSQIAVFAAFLVLNANPMLLDYFSVARGYGIGLGFLMCGVWLSAECISEESGLRSLQLGCLALMAATLSSFSNYIFLHFYSSLCVCIFTALVWKWKFADIERSSSARALGIVVSFVGLVVWNSFLVFVFAGREIIDLKLRGRFYTGGKSGFWHDTIHSVMEHSFSGVPSIVSVVEMGLIIVLTFGLFSAIWSLRDRYLLRSSLPYLGAAVMTIISGLTAWLQRPLFGMNYLTGRCAVLFVPLIGFLVVIAIKVSADASIPRLRSLGSWLCMVLLLFLTTNFISAANLTYTPWRYDADTKVMIEDLSLKYRNDLKGKSISLGIEWYLAPSINFYRELYGLSWLESVTREGLDGEYDFYYYTPESRAIMENRNIKILRTYETTGNRLARRLGFM